MTKRTVESQPIFGQQSAIQTLAHKERVGRMRSYIASQQRARPQFQEEYQVPELQFPSGFEYTEPEELQTDPWYKKPSATFARGLEQFSRPFVWINETFEKPWAALLVLAAQGISPGEGSLQKAMAERDPEEGWFETLTRAYSEDENLSTAGKFILEASSPLWFFVPMGAIMKGVGKVTSPAIRAVTSQLMKVPTIKKLATESPKSLAFNAPRRGLNLLDDMRGAYSSFYGVTDLGDVTLLQRMYHDLMNGTMDPRLREHLVGALTHKGSKSGSRLIRIFDDVLGGDAAVADQVKRSLKELEPVIRQGDATWNQLFDTFSGSLRQAYAHKAGLHNVTLLKDTFSDVYQFWRAGVLTTPTYFLQNLVEDWFRVVVSTFEPMRWGPGGFFDTPMPFGRWHLPKFQATYEAARKGMVHPEISNSLLPAQLRSLGYRTASEAKVGLSDAVKLNRLMADDVALNNPALAKKLMRDADGLEKFLKELPDTSWRGAPSPVDSMGNPNVPVEATAAGGRSIVPIDAVTESGSLYTKQHPMNRTIDGLIERLRKPGLDRDLFLHQTILTEQGAEAAKRFYSTRIAPYQYTTEAIKRKTKAIGLSPRNWAAQFDTTALAEVYRQEYLRLLRNVPKGENLLTMVDDKLFTKDRVTAMKKLGIRDDQIQALRDRIPFIDSPEDLAKYFFETVADPYPGLHFLENSPYIPQAISDSYVPRIRQAAWSGKRKEMKHLRKEMSKEIRDFYTNPENYRNQLADEALTSIRKSYSSMNDMFKDVDVFINEIETAAKRTNEVLSQIYDEKFMKTFMLRDDLFRADYLAVSAEAHVMELKYLSKFYEGRRLRVHGARANELRAKFRTEWVKTIEQTREAQNALLKHTMAFSEFAKQTPDPVMRLNQWQAAFDTLNADGRFSFMLQGLNRNEVNIPAMWANYRLTRSHLYHNAVRTVAEALEIPPHARLIAYMKPVKMKILEAENLISNQTRRILDVMPSKQHLRGINKLDRRVWTYMNNHPDTDIVDIATRWGVDEGDVKAAINTLAEKRVIEIISPEDIVRGTKLKYKVIEEPPRIPRRGEAKQKDAFLDKFLEDAQRVYDDPQVIGGKMAEWRNRAEARVLALDKAYGVMGDYGVETGLDSLMGNFFPFWYFPSRSLPFYINTFMQKPYLMQHVQRYIEHTKNAKTTPEVLVGYVPVPVGDQYFYINPMRPWMGYQVLGHKPLAGAGQPMFQEVLTMLGMAGLGINPMITWSAEAINNVTSTQGLHLTRGEIQPLFPQLRWMQDLIGTALGTWLPSPEQSLFAQAVDGMPDWKRRTVEKEMARFINLNPEVRERWPTPRHIMTDAKQGSPEAQKVLEQQIRRISAFGLLSTALPVVNRRNKEEIQMYNDRDEMLRDVFRKNGVDDDAIEARFETAHRMGFSPMMYLNRAQRREIYEAKPEWEPWQGLTRVGIRPEEREMERQTQEFFETFDEARRQIQEQLSVVDNAFMEGLITGYDWRMRYNEIQQFHSSVFMALVGDGLAPDQTSNPGRLPLARVTQDRTEYFRKKYGTVLPPVHPEDQALDFYNSISPQLDPITGMWDFDTYFAQRDEFMSQIPRAFREYIEEDARRSRYNSQIEAMYRTDLQVLKPYLSARRDIEKMYPEFKRLQELLRREQDPQQQQIIRQQLGRYERMVTERREKIRIGDAKLEAILLMWGYIQTPINPKTHEVFPQVISRTIRS